jgi:Protein of unknown function (DUF2845)
MHRKVTQVGLLPIVLMLSLGAHSVLASDRSMRCGGDLIYAGGGKDSAAMYEVLKKCGEPVEKQGSTWIYIQGNVRRELTFNYESRLQRIQSFR